VIATIAIMVLVLRPPHEASLAGLVAQVPVYLSYILSFLSWEYNTWTARIT
jgi:hypothetical protein